MTPFVLLGLAIFLAMWGVKRFVAVTNPIYESIMAVIAVVIAILIVLGLIRVL